MAINPSGLTTTLLCSATHVVSTGSPFAQEGAHLPIGAVCSVALSKPNGGMETLTVEVWKKVAPDIWLATYSKK